MDIISTRRLFASGGATTVSPELRVLLSNADVINGVDVASQREYTVYGTPSLEETMRIGVDVAVPTVRVELDEQAGDLDKLVALVRAVKSRFGN